MFKTIVTDPPYGDSGLSPRGWREVRTKYVPIAELVATQDSLRIAGIAPTHRGLHNDPLIHVVKHQGVFYLEDGHHRAAREALAGASHINARVLNLDRQGPPPVPSPAVVSADDQSDIPGLVWVEGKGYRSVHLARALEVAGGRVDWHRWTEGAPEELKPLPYRDAA